MRIAMTVCLVAVVGAVSPLSTVPAGALATDETVPNDPLFARQVSFRNPGGEVAFDIESRRPSRRSFACVRGVDLNVVPAWSITTGSRNVVVGVIDDGFFYDHEDLEGNIWKNPGECGPDDAGYPKESNGVDDDGNGYVDDVMGWDWAFDDPDPDCYVFDGRRNDRIQPYWHSIAALGIIGARGDNGRGVAGICWRVSMMLLKIGAQGTQPPEVARRGERAARAIRYAADNGARVINWSGFVSKPTPEGRAALRDAIAYAGSKGVLLVLGAGNSGVDIDRDENCYFPQSIDLPNVLNVAEVDLTGKLDRASGRHHVSGSCWGVRRVGIAAIARNYTTDVQDGRSTYRLGGGTSCAAPVVTGVCALMLSVNPDLHARDLIDILLTTARPLPSLKGKVTCGGMVDAAAAVRAAAKRRGTAGGDVVR